MTDDPSIINMRKQMAAKYASKYGLDLALICSVVHHESGWNNYATKDEPQFFDYYIQPLLNSGAVKTITEARERATSWGLMQIMGQTAREFGFSGRFLAELTNPDVGLEFGCRKLKRCMELHNDDIRAALLAYNGGGDPSYPDLVLICMPIYSSRE